MARGKLRKVVGLAVVVGAIVTVVRRLRGTPAPQFSNHPTVAGGPAYREPVAELDAGDVPVAELEPGGATWADPVDGECPDGFPIKAKLSSGIFHQPGGLSYDRTKPDRCYLSAAAAEADGLRPAKR